jgi:hypothetical protein
MTKILARTYTYTNEFRAYITYALLGACMLLALVYIANIYRVISHSVALQHIEVASNEVAGTVEELDTKYIELSNRITPDLVRSRGMSEGKVTSYISRSTSLGVVSMSGYEL